MSPDDFCYCHAYAWAHYRGEGDCKASGKAHCPGCGVVLDDGQVQPRVSRKATRHTPEETVVVVSPQCGNCGTNVEW